MNRFQLVVAVCLFASLAHAADAPPPLSDRVPDDAMVYIGWCGSDAFAALPAYQQSNLKALLDASAIRGLMSQSIPRLIDRIARKNNNPQALEAVKTVRLIGTTLWKYPCAIYFKVDLAGPMPMPRGAIFARAGADAANVQKQLDELISHAQVPPQLPVRAFVIDDIVGVSIGFDDGAQALVSGVANDAKSLAASGDFSQSLARLGAVAQNPAFTVYVNNDAVMDVGEKMVMNNPKAAELWPRMKEATGLGGFHRAIFACGFDGKDWSDCGFIEAPSPRKGFLALGENPPISDESLAMIPVSATSVAAGGMNLARTIASIRTMLGEVDPNAAGGMNMVLGIAQMYTGVNLERDLFGALGDRWIMYEDPQIAGAGGLGTVIVNKLADPDKAGKALDTLAAKLNATIKNATAKDDVEFAFRELKSGEITVHYFAIPFIAPSWTIRDGYLYVSFYPQTALSAAKREKPVKSILENEKFIAMRDRLGVKEPASITFEDLPASAPQNYQTMLMFTRLLVGGLDVMGARAPEFVLPPFPELAALLAPAGSASWFDADGIHWRAVEPFPAAGLVTGPGASVVVAAPALMLSITLPSLNRARETANRIKCASNLRQIGQAILLWSNDNKGQYPPDLGSLIVEDITPEVFLCPDTDHHVPANWKTMTQEQQADWINTNSDYQYIGAGMDNAVPADMIVVYERGNPHGDGINILFGDGHVSFELTQHAQQYIREQGDRKK